MKSIEEKEIFNLMDGISAEDLVNILTEIPMDDDLEISKKIRQEIKNKTFQKIGIRPVKRKLKRNLALAVAASLLVTLLGISSVDTDDVWAKLQKALQYIPGINIVMENKEKEIERYVLSKPIEQRISDGYVKIKGVIIDENYAIIAIKGSNLIKYKDNLFFRNAAGERFKIDGYRLGGSNFWEGEFFYRGWIKDIKDLELVFPDAQKTAIPLPLVKAKSYQSYAEMGPTVIVNGISITAIAIQEKNKIKINLVSPPIAGARIDFYGFGMNALGITLKDRNGRNYPVSREPGGFSPPLSEFIFDTETAKTRDFTLSIPYVGIVYNDEQQTLKVDIPEKGTSKINKTVKLAGFPIDFEKIEKIADNIIRIYINVHFDEKAKASLRSFNLDKMSWSAKMDEKNGAYKILEFEVAPNQRSVKLDLKEPLVIKKGPWEIQIKK